MLTSYIRAAMRQARYEMIADEKPFYGHIPECPGVWASGRTLEECRDELQETLEEWLSLGLRLSLSFALQGYLGQGMNGKPSGCNAAFWKM